MHQKKKKDWVTVGVSRVACYRAGLQASELQLRLMALGLLMLEQNIL